MTLEEEDEQEERARFAPRKASEHIRQYGRSTPEQGRHIFTRHADGSLRTGAGTEESGPGQTQAMWDLTGPAETMRYCINAAVAKAYFGSMREWAGRTLISGVDIAQIRLAQYIAPEVNLADKYPHDVTSQFLDAIGLLARWQDADGRTAVEVIELLEREGL